MAKKYEFKPDKPRSGVMSKLFLTKKQRVCALKWTLYALVLLTLSVLQDVLLCRIRIFDATTELVPCGIFLICLAEGLEGGSVFSLVAAALYLFSGSASGYYSIVYITFLSVGVTFFRQSFLRKSFLADMLCTVVAVTVYVMAEFFTGVFLEYTGIGRIFSHMVTALLTIAAAPLLYPVVSGIRTVGGDIWKE